MNQDPDVRNHASSVLEGLFSRLGHPSGGGSSGGGAGGALGGAAGQLEQLFEMPLDLAEIFLSMSVQLTELILNSLEEAGIVLVRGLSPV